VPDILYAVPQGPILGVGLTVHSDVDLRRADIAVPRRLRKPLHGSFKLRHLNDVPTTADLNLGRADVEHGPVDGT
jgi:hypothetical protein